MEAVAVVEENGEHQVEESLDATHSLSTSSPKQIANPVVYKLVRVEGDGSLVPATDDEVMEVENMLEDEKVEVPLVADTRLVESCMSNEESSSVKANLVDTEGKLQAENTKVDAEKLNARLEYIGVMLQKVKQEESLRLSSGSPDASSNYTIVDGQCSNQHDQFSTGEEKLQTENSLQENVPLLSPILSDSCTNQVGSGESCLKPADDSVVDGSSASASCSSSMPDFSRIKGEICLDNLSIKELHETFRATFGRVTSVKDKLWLKRRIAMGLTNSCEVSTPSFKIKDKTLVGKKAREAHCGVESSKNVDQISEIDNDCCKDSPTIPTNQMGDRQVASGKRLRKTQEEYECKSEDIHTEKTEAKRVRKPTRRYIEELSEAETRECSGRLVSSIKNSGHGQYPPKSCVRPVCNISSDGATLVTRQDSLGGSGVQVPYVSRVRRGRPRENFMSIMQYHPSGMGMAARLVKKALGVRISLQDSESGSRNWKARFAPKHIQQQMGAERDKEKPDVVACTEQQQKAVKLENVDSFGDNSDCNATVPTSKGGTRRKHHRAWTLCEVIKLVEGVSKYGAGRWSEIKRVSFASYTYRTSVDLKDKWRNLLRASFSLAPNDNGIRNSRKHASMPVPAPILLRVRQLAEKHSQAAPDFSSGKFSGFSGSVHVTKSGYL